MNVRIGGFYMDNDDVVYEVIALTETVKYSEAVCKVVGHPEASYMHYAIFYRNNWAWCDRENPDFRLTDEVDYVPRVVSKLQD